MKALDFEIILIYKLYTLFFNYIMWIYDFAIKYRNKFLVFIYIQVISYMINLLFKGSNESFYHNFKIFVEVWLFQSQKDLKRLVKMKKVCTFNFQYVCT